VGLIPHNIYAIMNMRRFVNSLRALKKFS